MIDEKNYCELCGVKKSLFSFMSSKSQCKKCTKVNEREAFLKQGGMPESRYEVSLGFKLNPIEAELLSSQSEKLYFSTVLVSRGANDFYGIETAKEKLVRRLKLMLPDIRSGMDIKAAAVEVGDLTPLTLFSEITQESFESSYQMPAIGPSPFTDEHLNAYSEALLKATIETMTDFLTNHPNKTFYAFAFDCNAEYGQVILAMNSHDDFLKTSKEYIEKWNYKESDLKELKFSTGDWEYQGLNLDYSYWESCRSYENKIDAYVFAHDTTSEDADALVEKLLNMFAETLIRFEATEVFQSIPKDAGFVTFAVDHDESTEDALARMNKIRINNQ